MNSLILRKLGIVVFGVLAAGCSASSAPASAGNNSAAPGLVGNFIVNAEPDYWPTVTWNIQAPEQQGFPVGALQNLADAAAAALPYYTSLLVVRNGYIVHESYHDTASETSNVDTKHHVWSVSKSVASLTVGRAWTKGDLTDLSVKVGDVFPAAITTAIAGNPLALDIKLEDALRMKSGIGWNERQWLLTANDPLMKIQGGNPAACLPAGGAALACAVLSQPIAHTPGTVWNYNTYDTYIVSAFFTSITGSTLGDYATSELFSPLGITSTAPDDWLTLTQSYTYAGGTLQITARDIARIALLVQYRGKWDGQQVIAEQWINDSLAAQGDGQKMNFDASGNPDATTAQNLTYGMQWWRSMSTSMTGPESITAIGLMGQLVHIFPAKGISIIVTCDSDDAVTPRYDAINQFVQTHILDKAL